MSSSDAGSIGRHPAAAPRLGPAHGRRRARLPHPVRELRIIQALLRRDMARQGLSLRMAAKTGPISIGSLSALLDPSRINDPTKQPKRPTRLPTLLHIKSLRWASPRTRLVIERLLAASDRASRKHSVPNVQN